MATKKTASKKDAKKEIKRVTLKKEGIKVTHIRETQYNTFFTLEYYGMSFYNMQMVEGKNENLFISEPQTKGKDGKYYKQYWLNLDEETQDYIIGVILKETDHEPDDQEELPFEP